MPTYEIAIIDAQIVNSIEIRENIQTFLDINSKNNYEAILYSERPTFIDKNINIILNHYYDLVNKHLIEISEQYLNFRVNNFVFEDSYLYEFVVIKSIA